MAYPQNITWGLQAFELLEQLRKEGKPFTSLDFKNRLRQLSSAPVRQAEVGTWLRQAFVDGHLEGFETEDNGVYRTYKPKPTPSVVSQVKGWWARLTSPSRN